MSLYSVPRQSADRPHDFPEPRGVAGASPSAITVALRERRTSLGCEHNEASPLAGLLAIRSALSPVQRNTLDELEKRIPNGRDLRFSSSTGSREALPGNEFNPVARRQFSTATVLPFSNARTPQSRQCTTMLVNGQT
jgi:hypothetical protein